MCGSYIIDLLLNYWYISIPSVLGSLTDSICTAYENRNVKKSNNNEMNAEKELVPATNISTMLGGI